MSEDSTSTESREAESETLNKRQFLRAAGTTAAVATGVTGLGAAAEGTGVTPAIICNTETVFEDQDGSTGTGESTSAATSVTVTLTLDSAPDSIWGSLDVTTNNDSRGYEEVDYRKSVDDQTTTIHISNPEDYVWVAVNDYGPELYTLEIESCTQ